MRGACDTVVSRSTRWVFQRNALLAWTRPWRRCGGVRAAGPTTSRVSLVPAWLRGCVAAWLVRQVDARLSVVLRAEAAARRVVAGAPTPGGVLVQGPRGAGKSSFLREVCRRFARDPGSIAHVVRHRAVPVCGQA